MKIIVSNIKVNGDRDHYAMTSDVEDSVRKAIVEALNSIDGVSVARDCIYSASTGGKYDIEFLNNEWEVVHTDNMW